MKSTIQDQVQKILDAQDEKLKIKSVLVVTKECNTIEGFISSNNLRKIIEICDEEGALFYIDERGFSFMFI